jgi:choline dehydrogenase
VSTPTRAYDIIVVGGGSAGCIVAAELSRDPRRRVLLLERGQPAEDNPETLSADGYKDAFINDRLFLERFTVPQEDCLGNRLFCGTGTGMGGSGSVNGMVYIRGDAADFDEWPEGWRWADVAAPFEALERTLRVRPRPPTRFSEVCVEAARQAGFRRSEDLNDGRLGGVLGYEQMNYEGDCRRSSYVAFLAGRKRPNLVVQTGVRVHRLRFGEGRRVAGVEYERQGAGCFTAAREVVLCAGALETPRLLMLSGVGPADDLRQHAVPVVLDQPQVGQNLHDHPNVTLFFAGDQPVDFNYPQLYGFYRANPKNGLPPDQPDTCYVFYPARSSLKQATQRLLPGMLLPPEQARGRGAKRLIRGAIDLAFRSGHLRRFVQRVYGIVLILGKPHSRGSLRLASADPERQALIDPGYLNHPTDLETMLLGVRLAQKMAATPALSRWGNRPLAPSPRRSSPEQLERWIRSSVMTTYHFAGTCRMGADQSAVVDPRLRLRGVQGVRLADASVIPVTPVSALNAPSMLVGYRAAQFIEEESHGHARAA